MNVKYILRYFVANQSHTHTHTHMSSFPLHWFSVRACKRWVKMDLCAVKEKKKTAKNYRTRWNKAWKTKLRMKIWCAAQWKVEKQMNTNYVNSSVFFFSSSLAFDHRSIEFQNYIFVIQLTDWVSEWIGHRCIECREKKDKKITFFPPICPMNRQKKKKHLIIILYCRATEYSISINDASTHTHTHTFVFGGRDKGVWDMYLRIYRDIFFFLVQTHLWEYLHEKY